MKRYLKAASSVTLNYKQLDLFLETRGLEAQCIKYFLSESKIWESMTDHREPATVKMVLCMHEKCKNKHPCRLESVLCDWDVLGIFYVFVLSELTQNFSNKM